MAFTLYFKARSKAILDENGEPREVGMTLESEGMELKEGCTYEDVAAVFNKERLVELCGLSAFGIHPEDIKIISEEEYKTVFGDK